MAKSDAQYKKELTDEFKKAFAAEGIEPVVADKCASIAAALLVDDGE